MVNSDRFCCTFLSSGSGGRIAAAGALSFAVTKERNLPARNLHRFHFRLWNIPDHHVRHFHVALDLHDRRTGLNNGLGKIVRLRWRRLDGLPWMIRGASRRWLDASFPPGWVFRSIADRFDLGQEIGRLVVGDLEVFFQLCSSERQRPLERNARQSVKKSNCSRREAAQKLPETWQGNHWKPRPEKRPRRLPGHRNEQKPADDPDPGRRALVQPEMQKPAARPRTGRFLPQRSLPNVSYTQNRPQFRRKTTSFFFHKSCSVALPILDSIPIFKFLLAFPST